MDVATWTRDGRIRHPSFKGLREDEPAQLIRRERESEGLRLLVTIILPLELGKGAVVADEPRRHRRLD